MIRVGVAGWDYPDWVGPVYPRAEARHIDRLAFLARYVDILEVNSTFYRPLPARTTSSWLRRAPASLAFTAKLHRAVTHDRADATEETLGPSLDGLRPVLEDGRLLALLVQFPHSFRFDDAGKARLEAIGEGLDGWPWVVELRRSEWEREDAQAWLSTLGAGWCVVDQPGVPGAARATPRVVGTLGYLRLHGRNAENWFKEGAGRDARYDYLYGEPEIDELADVARAMADTAENLVVVQNNHFRGQALVNALQLKHRLTGARPAAPQTLVESYPALACEVTVERQRLF